MSSQVVSVKVESPGTMEQHIVGYMLDSGTKFDRIQMVTYIQLSPDAFYTDADGKKAKLVVSQTEEGTRYVKTVGDSTKKNNLLSLPRYE